MNFNGIKPALRPAWMMVFLASCVALVPAQDLAPRAYVISPLHSNAVTVADGYYNGSISFNGAAPITGATGNYNVPILSYYHSFGFFGRSANVLLGLPYAVGTFQGEVVGVGQQIYRSGLGDSVMRLSINLRGGRAMDPREFAKWKQKRLLGVSLKVVAPTGQYDGNKLVNWGSNRWSFKPEFGYSGRLGHMLLDTYGGVWFFTTNQGFYSATGPHPQTQRPIGSFEGHLSYDVKPRFWFSLDGNYWFGGVTSVNGVADLGTRQLSSRIGVTGSFPLWKHQSIKISYADGAYVRFGGNYQNVSIAWQYSWLGRPR
jgi:hypothetical protein